MKRLGLVLLSVALIFGMAAMGSATTPLHKASDCLLGTNCVNRIAVRSTYTYTPYVAPVATYYEAVAVPIYTVYGPSVPTDQTERVNKLTDELVKAKDEQIALLKAIVASGGLPPELKAGMAPMHPGEKLERETCASCHDASDSAKKAKGHVLFKGGVFIGTEDDLVEMREQVEAGKMPPGNRWKDKERMLWMSWLSRRAPREEPPAKAEAPKTPKTVPETKKPLD